MRYPSGKFKLRAVFEVRRADVPVPLGLALAIVVLALIVIYVLFLFLALQLLIDGSAISAAAGWSIAFCGAILPVFTAYCIVNNRPIGRWLLLCVATILLFAINTAYLNIPLRPKPGTMLLATSVLGFVLVIILNKWKREIPVSLFMKMAGRWL